MLQKIRNNSIKIYIFVINFLLATVGVFLIREKDQSRLIEQAVKDALQQQELTPVQDRGNNDAELNSFENNLNSTDSNTSPDTSSGNPVSSNTSNFSTSSSSGSNRTTKTS